MCGIGGIIFKNNKPVEKKLLRLMAGALEHRGPDGIGYYIDDGLGLVHRRLAIIDLENGAQPMENHKHVLVANGEIYNYLELRQQFPQYHWKTKSDCESILNLFSDDDSACFNHLRGMFAFAIYNKSTRHLMLARDPYGIKPLYIAETEDAFIFASESKAILATGLVDREVDSYALGDFLAHQFVHGKHCLFKSIKRVKPGDMLHISQGHIVQTDRLKRSLGDSGKWSKSTEAELIEQLDHVLNDSLNIHLRSDVPYGLFLSGGIDSNSILSLLRRFEAPRICLTAQFKELGMASVHNEMDQASQVADLDRHIKVTIGEQDFLKKFPQIIEAFDDCTADYAMIPTWFLGEAASKAGLKVILSGEGGDEFFAGYGRYRKRFWHMFKKQKTFPKNCLAQIDLLHQPWHQLSYQDSMAMDSSILLSDLQKKQLCDIDGWLAPDLLLKLDRSLMSHGVEGRTPFVDQTLSTFAFSLPDKVKIKSSKGKWILRQWLHKNQPLSNAFGRKRGFSVPVANWLYRHRKHLVVLIKRQKMLEQWMKLQTVEHLFEKQFDQHFVLCWHLLVFIVWYKIHIECKKPNDFGDLFTLLEKD
ncbi:MAG: asparagine synthase (glutamine-hydrolyzing) [Pseudomonadota bacterium]